MYSWIYTYGNFTARQQVRRRLNTNFSDSSAAWRPNAANLKYQLHRQDILHSRLAIHSCLPGCAFAAGCIGRQGQRKSTQTVFGDAPPPKHENMPVNGGITGPSDGAVKTTTGRLPNTLAFLNLRTTTNSPCQV